MLDGTLRGRAAGFRHAAHLGTAPQSRGFGPSDHRDAQGAGGIEPGWPEALLDSSQDPCHAQESGHPTQVLRSALALRLARPGLFAIAVILAGITGLVLLPDRGEATAQDELRPTQPEAIAAPAPGAAPNSPAQAKPAFVPIIRPIRLFALEAPELVKVVADYDASRAIAGDGREDRLSFGSAARGDAPYMRLAVYRAGSEAADAPPLFVDLTRSAALAGLAVLKSAPGEPMRTKFGEMETAEIKLGMAGVERSCLAFRRAVGGEKLRLTGWYCAPIGSFAGRAVLSCLIDRLALLSAGEDMALRDSFVAAERRRQACGKARVVAASAGGSPVDNAANPPRLRGAKTK